MVQKIQSTEYMKRLDNMLGAERAQWQQRVGEWLRRQAPVLSKKMEQQEAAFQNPLQASMTWNDQECQAWHEGVILMSALISSADTWLPDALFVKSAKRGIRQIIRCLQGAYQAEEEQTAERGLTPQSGRMIAGAAKEAGYGKPGASNGRIGNGGKDRQEGVDTNTHNPTPISHHLSPFTKGAVPARPKHIDQYVHLLPKKTQERAAQVRQLLRDMDAARENTRMLAAAGEHPDKIASWSKTATSIDNKLRSIYDELDREWEKLVDSGCVGVDAFGNAFITEKGEKVIKEQQQKSKRGRKPMTEEEKKAAEQKRSEKLAARQKEKDDKEYRAKRISLFIRLLAAQKECLEFDPALFTAFVERVVVSGTKKDVGLTYVMRDGEEYGVDGRDLG